MTLPKRLGKEPLLEAIFEMRFMSQAPVSSILPGFLFSMLPGQKRIDRLPAAELPQQVRSIDLNLRYAPLLRIDWDDYFILLGDWSVGLACKLPYPGWSKFKPAILELTKSVASARIIDSVERFSLKYTDIIPAELGDVSSLVKFVLMIGEHSAAADNFQIRVEVPSEDRIHVVSLSSAGVAKLADGSARNGVAIDIDTIATLTDMSMSKFSETLPDKVEAAHLENKARFFDCLKPETMASRQYLSIPSATTPRIPFRMRDSSSASGLCGCHSFGLSRSIEIAVISRCG
jgi:uncharacterized protein (TIGR04255 family)